MGFPTHECHGLNVTVCKNPPVRVVRGLVLETEYQTFATRTDLEISRQRTAAERRTLMSELGSELFLEKTKKGKIFG